jgi:hypothetical protein
VYIKLDIFNLKIHISSWFNQKTVNHTCITTSVLSKKNLGCLTMGAELPVSGGHSRNISINDSNADIKQRLNILSAVCPKQAISGAFDITRTGYEMQDRGQKQMSEGSQSGQRQVIATSN